jgi:hypothetical protein
MKRMMTKIQCDHASLLVDSYNSFCNKIYENRHWTMRMICSPNRPSLQFSLWRLMYFENVVQQKEESTTTLQKKEQ